MPVEVKVPEMGESITEGTLTQWYKEDGDFVEASDSLYELETDKITVDVPCEHEGCLHILVEAGSRVGINQTVATIDTEASRPEPTSVSGKRGRKVRSGAEGAARAPLQLEDTRLAADRTDKPPSSSEGSLEPSTSSPTEEEPASRPNGLKQAQEEESGRTGGWRLSPSVRRMIREHHLNPEQIPGTGGGGRVTREDVLDHLRQRPWPGSGRELVTVGGIEDAGQSTLRGKEPGSRNEPSPETGDWKMTRESDGSRPAWEPSEGPKEQQTASDVGTDGGAAAERQTRTRMSAIRQRIAERLVLAQQTAAILTTFNEADMSRVLAWRARHKDDFKEKYGVSLGFMSFFVKAVVDALKNVPALNAQIQGDEIVQNHYYDIGVAIGTDRGLVVPVIRDADRLGFGEIEREIADLARRVKDRVVTLADLTGGVFTISNGGVYGSLLSTPILNPPQSGILGMHAIKKRPLVVEDQIVIRPMMYLALSYDHRLVDGREAVTFLKRIVQCIENPERMILEV